VQEAVLRAYRVFDGLRGEARPWLLAIVRNSCPELAAGQPARGTAGFDDARGRAHRGKQPRNARPAANATGAC